MRVIVWLFRAFVFFALFAFALNNQQDVAVHWFFGVEWHAPMVIVVLVAFAAGCAVGVLAMVPAWWKHRRVARRLAPVLATAPATVPMPMAPSEFGADQHPPRDGL
ncbi:MAG: LapA family protein [Pseudomonadota bacterium]|nr:LapA family protein [Pseudomonadota bacterium]